MTVWADTGEVSSMYQMLCGIEPAVPSKNDQEPSALSSSTSPPAPIVIAILPSIAGLSVIGIRHLSTSMVKGRLAKKFWVALLCLAIVFNIVLTTAPIAGATLPDSQRSKFMVYGIQNGTGLPVSEADAAREVTNYIGNKSSDNGYDTTNLYGADTTYANVMSYTQGSEDNFSRVAMFHFGHYSTQMYGAYQDNNAVPIWAANISECTEAQKHFFVWLWVCEQAYNASYPMPYAWTHRDLNHGGYMSNWGYGDPDNGDHCFITFDGISPQIGNSTCFNDTQAFPYGSPGPLKNFITNFTNYALSDAYQYSVKDALNAASQIFFQTTYENCVLNKGQDSSWYTGTWYPGDNFTQPPRDPAYWPGHMLIFGNGNIKLYQPKITLTANHGPPTFYVDGSAQSPGDIRVIPGEYSINVGDDNIPSGYAYDHLVYVGYSGWQAGRPADFLLLFDGTVQAYYAYTEPTAPSQPELSGPSSSMYRTAEYEFTATSSDANEFNSIRYNFDWGDGTSTLTDYHYNGQTAYASHAWSSTGEKTINVTAQDSTGLWSSPSYLNVTILQESYEINVYGYGVEYGDLYPNVWVDGNYAGTAPITGYLAAVGQHTITVDGCVDNWYFVCFSGHEWYTNPITVEVTSGNLYETAVYANW